MVLKLPKIAFLQFCAESSKKSTSIKAIYIYASQRSRYALAENGIVCYAIIMLYFQLLISHERWLRPL